MRKQPEGVEVAMKEIKIGKIAFGGENPLVLFAGPCVIESERLCLEAAGRIKEIAGAQGFPVVFKSSFDKANRMSIGSYRGPGRQKGLAILKKVKQKTGLAVITDVHCPEDVRPASAVADVLQIPALLCRQTDLSVACARTGKPVNLKKGQFMAPWDMAPLLNKIKAAGNKKVFVTERGVSFGYNNLVTDLRAFSILRAMGVPVVFDGTHSVQLPGGKGGCSSGQREFVPGLCRAAVAFGCDGLFLEVHPHPDKALCDSANMIDYRTLERLLQQVRKIRDVL